MGKKKIVFLLTGESRTFPFSLNKQKRNINILNSYNKFIFTDEFKTLYDYKLYISTDDIHLHDTISYFSVNNIGNIHLLNTGFYFIEPKNKTENINIYFDKYNNKEWMNHQKYDNSIYQHYKILDCYNLFKNSEPIEECDYIIRLRMDVEITYSILDILYMFEENSELEIIVDWDWCAIGKPKIMDCYCSGLNNNYGNYNYQIDVPDILPIMPGYKHLCRYKWTYSPERQLFEMIFEYCKNNNLDINKSIRSLIFSSIISKNEYKYYV